MEEKDDETVQMKQLDSKVYELDIMLGLLKEISQIGENKVTFFSTYSKWENMNDHQRFKAQDWFSKLTIENQLMILEKTKHKTEEKKKEELVKMQSNRSFTKNVIGSQMWSFKTAGFY